jgi:hypothetical protein
MGVDEVIQGTSDDLAREGSGMLAVAPPSLVPITVKGEPRTSFCAFGSVPRSTTWNRVCNSSSTQRSRKASIVLSPRCRPSATSALSMRPVRLLRIGRNSGRCSSSPWPARLEVVVDAAPYMRTNIRPQYWSELYKLYCTIRIYANDCRRSRAPGEQRVGKIGKTPIWHSPSAILGESRAFAMPRARIRVVK